MAQEITQKQLSRRQFLHFSAVGGSALLVAACVVPPGQTGQAPADATADAAHEAEATADAAHEAEATHEAETVAEGDVQVMVKDVLEYKLDPDGWDGGFGAVTFMLHGAMYNGEMAYHIRTDASDPAVAEEIGLVYVPLLNAAAGLAEGETNTYYMFSNDHPAVIAKIPGDENYSSLFRVMKVDPGSSTADLNSAADIVAAAAAGEITVEPANYFVNYPLIQWPGGGLSVDTELKGTLDNGQLFAAPDIAGMTVTMKLHQCYPGSRYIVTDAGMMAPMMSIADAAVTNKLQALGGTDEIWVFGNGIPGPGAMGFQPAIFDNKAGQPAWSPFWDHRTLVWKDESKARLLHDSTEVRAAIEAGEVDEFMGVPDSHPTGFVVNCPAPILAPNTFAA